MAPKRNPGRGSVALRRSVNDADAFAEFYEAYAERVLIFFTRRVFDVEIAMELTSETFAQALIVRRQFRGTTPEEEQGWLFAIARSQLTRYLRRGEIERAALARLGLEVQALPDDGIERIERMAGLEQLKQLIVEALVSLSDQQRRAVELRVLDERDYRDIAQILSVSEQVVRARVSRGLATIADAIDAGGLDHEGMR